MPSVTRQSFAILSLILLILIMLSLDIFSVIMMSVILLIVIIVMYCCLVSFYKWFALLIEALFSVKL
jgi:hypothetical protein